MRKMKITKCSTTGLGKIKPESYILSNALKYKLTINFFNHLLNKLTETSKQITKLNIKSRVSQKFLTIKTGGGTHEFQA